MQATQVGKFILFIFLHNSEIDRCRQASLFLSLLILSALQAALGPQEFLESCPTVAATGPMRPQSLETDLKLFLTEGSGLRLRGEVG